MALSNSQLAVEAQQLAAWELPPAISCLCVAGRAADPPLTPWEADDIYHSTPLSRQRV